MVPGVPEERAHGAPELLGGRRHSGQQPAPRHHPANNTTNVATAVLDRLEVIQMPAYTDTEKIEIGKHYVLPKAIVEVGLTPEQLQVDEALWPKLVRPLGFEPGIRSLERVVQEMVRKAAYKMVSGQGTQFVINDTNIKEFTSEIVL